MDEVLKGLPTIIGVLIGGALTGINSWFSDRRVSLRSRSYSAVRIICVLENLISACENIVIDEGEYDGNGERWAVFKNLKTIDFPSDIDWKLIDHKLAYSLLTLQTHLENVNRSILATSDYDGPPDYDDFFLARKKHYSKFGISLLMLLREVSHSNNIQIGFDTHNRAEKVFKETIKKIEKKEATNSLGS